MDFELDPNICTKFLKIQTNLIEKMNLDQKSNIII